MNPNGTLFWTITGEDFARSIAWSRRQRNPVADQIRLTVQRYHLLRLLRAKLNQP